MEETKDWKGNVIKEGDEICQIKIKTGGFFKNAGWVIPHVDGTFTSHKIPDEPENDCWEIGNYDKVVLINNNLIIIHIAGNFTFHHPISLIPTFMDSKHILAIKGISDIKPKHR